MALKMDAFKIPSDIVAALVSHIWFYATTGHISLFAVCLHFLECSGPGGKSFKPNMHTLIQNFDSYKLTSESSDILFFLIVSRQISEIEKIICTQTV
jgi:hypothetical protein